MHLKALSEISGKSIKFNVRSIKTSSSLRKSLSVHAKRESKSIELYREIALKCENILKKRILLAIADQESRHLSVVKKYLHIIRDSK